MQVRWTGHHRRKLEWSEIVAGAVQRVDQRVQRVREDIHELRRENLRASPLAARSDRAERQMTIYLDDLTDVAYPFEQAQIRRIPQLLVAGAHEQPPSLGDRKKLLGLRTVSTNGFSTYTCAPAWSASQAGSKCEPAEVQMCTTFGSAELSSSARVG